MTWHPLHRLFGYCDPYLEETGVFLEDGWLPVTGVPTPVGRTTSGSMYVGGNAGCAREVRCGLCGATGAIPGRPREVKRTFRSSDGRGGPVVEVTGS